MSGRRSSRDFEEEIRAHLELEAERLRALGMSAEEAEATARRNFGNVGNAQDRFRDAQPLAWLEGLRRDLTHARRALLRTPGFLITAIGTLALAIGVVAGMFNVVNTVLLRPLPFPNPDRLLRVTGTAPGTDLPERFDVGPDFYVHYKESSKLLDGVFMFSSGTSTLRTDTRVERVGMAWATIDLYATLGVRPQLGRLPVPEDDDGVVVISDTLWRSWFGRDPAVIGKSFFVSDEMKQVIGVMPPEFRFPADETMLWVATPVKLEELNPGQLGVGMVARMKPGVTQEQVAQELTRLSKELPARFGGPAHYARLIDQHTARVEPLLDSMVGPAARTSLWLMLAAVAVVLLIACANVANLFLVRAETRIRDMAVRRALGASRGQLIRLQIAEAFLVAVPAGLLAILLSAVAVPLFLRHAPRGLPRLDEARLDLATVGAAFGLVIVAVLICGAIPALRASAPDLTRIRGGGRAMTGGSLWARHALVAGQTALALVLLIGSALLVQSFQRLRNVDPGYDTADLYTFQFAPDQESLNDGPAWGPFHVAFMERLRALPGVTAVGLVNNIPLDEGTPGGRFLSDAMADDGDGALLDQNFTAGDYFRAMGIELLQGRTFTDQEAFTPNSSVVISRSVATKLWPNETAVGQRLRRITPNGPVAFNWREAGEAVVYFPLTGPTANLWQMGRRPTRSSHRAPRRCRRRSASWCARSRRRRPCIASTRWSSSRSAPRWRCRSRC